MESQAHALEQAIRGNVLVQASATFNNMMAAADGGYIRNLIERAPYEKLVEAIAMSEEVKPQENGICNYAAYLVPECAELDKVKDDVTKAEQALKDAWVHVFNLEYYTEKGKYYDYGAFLDKMQSVIDKKDIEDRVRAEMEGEMRD